MGISSVLGTGALVPAGYGFRNLIINGAMQVAQRGTSASSKTTSGYYTADRWNFEVGSIGTWTESVENDAPDGSGFRKSLKLLCTSATASPAAGGYCLVGQRFEGQNLQSIKKGTSSAERVTLTFWVKSNVTGTYIAELYDNDNTRQVSASYTVSASATWEKKTIVFPADTTGAFDNDNAYSLSLFMHLAAGSNYTSGTLNTTWASSTSANRVVGQTNVAAATNNYWQITGVQLEVGPVATAYEFKPIDVEISQCQRYYEKSYNIDVNPGTSTSVGIDYFILGTTAGNQGGKVNMSTTKRAAPTITTYTQGGTSGQLSTDNHGSVTANVLGQGMSGFSVYYQGGANSAGAIYFHWVADIEL